MTGIDEGRVRERLAYICEQVRDLRQLAAQAGPALLQDRWLIRGARYALQTAIEAMIDILYHLSAKGFSFAPAHAREAVDHLWKKGLINEDEAEIFREMIGFRNRLFHHYHRVDDEKILEILKHRLDDFDRFRGAVLRLLATQAP